MESAIKKIISIIPLVATTQAFSFAPQGHGHPVLQLGGYWANQGKEQHINIQTLIGDQFTVTQKNSSNGLAGVGYFIDGQEYTFLNMAYGLNFFYLAPTRVSGTVIQENLFTNLAYAYHLTHYPLYAVAKATLNRATPYTLTADVGIGPNFMRASDFHERSIDNGVTIPDNIFSSRTNTTFSAMAGVGIKLNQIFGPAPLECGYKFFYLGQSSLRKANDQVLDTLKTGSGYANAVMCSFTA